MKKNNFFLSIIILILIVSFAFYKKEKLKKENTETYSLDEISLQEAQEDCIQLKKWIEDYYAGYEFEKENIDFEQASKLLMDSCLKKSANGYIKTDIFLEEIYKAYSTLRDGHFSFAKKNADESYQVYRLHKHFDLYFSEFYYQKRNNGFFLFENNGEKIAEDIPYINLNDGTDLFYYPVKGNDVYRLGILNQEKIGEIPVNVNGQITNTPVKLSNPIDYKFLFESGTYNRIVRINTKESKKSTYISCNTFEDVESRYDIFNTIDLSVKQNLILDFRGNQGGYVYYISNFFAKLLFTDVSEQKRFIKNMSKFPIRKKKILGKVFTLRNKLNEKFSCNKNINIYILCDCNSVSCSEFIIRTLRNIENVNLVVIGQNTAGFIKSGSGGFACLKNSRLYIQIPTFYFPGIQIKAGREEYGIFPDVWAIDNDVLDTLVLLTGDSELRNVLPFLDYQLE